MKKKVMLITNHDDDVYCFRKELIEGIIAEGYDMLISCPYGEKLELMKNVNFDYDDCVIDRRGMNPFADFKLFKHYYQVMKEEKPDVVLTYTAKPNVYASIAASVLKIPYINNVTGLGSVLSKGAMIQKAIISMFKIAFRNSSCIFFQNAENMELAKTNGLIKGEHKLIPGSGVNTERFPLQEYPSDVDGIVFNYIGRVLHDKGIDDYIEAAKRIKVNYPKTEFNIIGFIEPTESHYNDDFELLEKQDIIRYRGSQKDVKPFITRSHATIHPSTYGEGMSNVLLESASSGRPVITTDNPGCRETLEDNVSGYMYHGGDVDALVEKIEDFLALDNEDRRSMGEAGRERMKKYFSRDIVVAAYLEKIADILCIEKYRNEVHN